MIYDSFRQSSAASRKLLAALVGGDLLFMVLHWLHVHTGLLTSELWSIGRDRGFGEMFQYLKYAGVMLALAHVFRRTRLPVLLLWIGVFGFLLLDDSMRIHERFGLGMMAWAHLPDFGGLRGRDFGELIYAAIGAVILTPVLVVTYIRSSPMARAISADLLLLLIMLLIFAVGGDTIHRLLSSTVFDTLAGLVEDGGEMLVLSLTCFYVCTLYVYISTGGACTVHDTGVKGAGRRR
ncbi:hypothetical protein GCM10011487_25790 [Steroidobacter agaridevorans]|uniref:Uncharacterized protein n=1 Tax=Steroidobacter agaridevorans TaxID=2695856 RepID=A0A829YBB6_9GAMM|nr:hypothetical protein [Steroidobacter agaridevorans]GFE80579.1 hypothetical protein GCM10011487_25790 [Steroidobacter agaridevorans]